MKTLAIVLGISLGLMSLAPATHAATYAESLAAADTALTAQNTDAAMAAVEVALAAATSDGEKGLALAKKGHILAFVKQDYAGARAAADEALKFELAPVAKVTALQVLARCQTKVDKNFSGAVANLEAAMALPDVDWAKPAIALSLAENYRDLGQLQKALDTFTSLTTMNGADADAKAGAYLNIGFIYQYDRKDFAKAKEAYANALKQRPGLQAEVDGHLGRMSYP